MAAGPSFKRVVLGFHRSVPDQMLRLAAELAELLRLDLFGLFVEEQCVASLAELPFLREFRPLGGGWRPIDVTRLADELNLAAHIVQRQFEEAVKALDIEASFRVVRGSTSETFASFSRAGDIVVIAEPASPAERMTQQFSWLLQAAFQSAAAVMLVPHRIARHAGSIVVIATAHDDPAIAVGVELATASREDLVLLQAYDGEISHDLGRKAADAVASAGITIKALPAGELQFGDASKIASALQPLDERLVILTHGSFDDSVATTIASMRRIPVLIIEPSEGRARPEPPPAKSPDPAGERAKA